jgi:pyrroloquinoline-quinone synthase
MFADISGLIGGAVVARGFLEPDALVHYDLHRSLDVRHARDFFAVLAPEWERGPEQRYLVEQGLRMGAMAFDQLFARLYRCRARRWVR